MKKTDKQFAADLVAEVVHDYHSRRDERRHFEAQWQLNTNFLMGNQHCFVTLGGGVEGKERDFYWQEREVFNHIAFIVETRLSKLNKVRPKLVVRPSSSDEDDQKTALASSKILEAASSRLKLDEVLSKGTMWAETVGSVFYKIGWDKRAGKVVGNLDGKAVCEGDVTVEVCPSYQVYPDNLSAQDIADCNSLIHAYALSVDEIERIFGKAVDAEDVDTPSMAGAGLSGGLGLSSAVSTLSSGKRQGMAVVIERYTRPTEDKPNGELAIVCSGNLLYYDQLPYYLGEDGRVDFPFIKQDSQVRPGCFYGSSIIERAIPVQRAYNAVKNRKHEFLNRISMGVLAVEDGSVDTDNLEVEGLSPGKILVYRQGATPPSFLDTGSIPNDFNQEEEKLLNEFIMISGVSEVMRSSSVPTSLTSGTAIKLLMDQDDTRMTASAERIRQAARTMAQMTLRLYKQFASLPRLSKCVGEGGEVQLLHWQASGLSGEDVVFATENELNDSISSRRTMVLELLKSGLLSDENGRLSDVMRHRVLDVLGYGAWEQTYDLMRLHGLKADGENASLSMDSALEIKPTDRHDVHIDQHTKYLLGGTFAKIKAKNPALEDKLIAHILSHKNALNNVENVPKNMAEIQADFGAKNEENLTAKNDTTYSELLLKNDTLAEKISPENQPQKQPKNQPVNQAKNSPKSHVKKGEN